MKKRNAAIDLMRYIFMLNICIWHFTPVHIFTRGYLAVEFFFVLSGFLLYQSVNKHQDKSVFGFLKSKYKRFYPKYLAAFVLSSVVFYRKYTLSGGEFSDRFDNTLGRIRELLMIQEVGIFGEGENVINGPTWYISALVYGSVILYAFYKVFGKKCNNFIFPSIVIVGYTYILHTEQMWSIEAMLQPVTLIGNRLMRAICGLCLGWTTHAVLDSHRDFFEGISKQKLNMILLCAISMFFVLEITLRPHDCYVLLCSPIIILCCFLPQCILSGINYSVFNRLGEISFDMLLIHTVVVKIFISLNVIDFISGVALIALYLITVTSIAFLFDFTFNRIKR